MLTITTFATIARDVRGALRYATVNEAFVREHGATAVGRRLRSAAPQGTWGVTAPGEFEMRAARVDPAVALRSE